MTMGIDETGENWCLSETWWDDVKENVKSFGVSQEDAQLRTEEEGKSRFNHLKMAINTVFMCVFI